MKRNKLCKSTGMSALQEKALRAYSSIGYKFDEMYNGMAVFSKTNPATGGAIYQFINHNGVCIKTASSATWRVNV